jgi:chromosome segregation ATPase
MMEILTVSYGELAEQRRRRAESRLAELQSAVVTARDDVATAEAERTATATAVEKAEQALTKQLDVTRKQLDKAGLGVDPAVAELNPRAAEVQFDARIRSAAPVKERQAEIDTAKVALRNCVAALNSARAAVPDSEHRLQTFVNQLLDVG